MNLMTRSKAILGGAVTGLGLLALLASPSLADNHNQQTKTPKPGSEMQMTPEQMREMHRQMQQMMTQCNAMMSRMQGMMSNHNSSGMMEHQNHSTGSGTMTPEMNQ